MLLIALGEPRNGKQRLSRCFVVARHGYFASSGSLTPGSFFGDDYMEGPVCPHTTIESDVKILL